MAYCIPAPIFSIGCFYVFGSLEDLHGATPSERTFLGVIPMFTSPPAWRFAHSRVQA